MVWVFIFLFLLVIGAKYYTAISTRNLERRLSRVRTQLDEVRKGLQGAREQQASVTSQMELTELRVRCMKELIQDLQLRLTRPEPTEESPHDPVSAAMMRF